MSYCRFENTSNDLRDCVDHWDDDLSKTEAKSRYYIAQYAAQIFEAMGVTFDDEEYRLSLAELKAAAS